MKTEATLKNGDVIRAKGTLFRVLSVMHHAGTGKSAGATFAKLKDLSTGAVTEQKYHHGDKVDTVELERKTMEYIYNEGDDFYFMDPQSFEQFPIKKSIIGKGEKFLTPNTKMPVDFHEGQPVAVVFPQYVEIKVTTSPPGIKGQEQTMKEVELENEMKIMVPQFIKEGDVLRISTETGKYIEKAKKEKT